jgi:tetratricopeptide (TPR) repeat protein
MILAAVVPHFQPKTKQQYFTMMLVLAGLSFCCIAGALWMKARMAAAIPPVLQKATALLEDRRYDEAVSLLVPVIREIEQSRGPQDTGLVRHLDLLATVYSAMKREPEAEALLRRSYDIRRRALGPDHPDSIASGDRLALSLMAQGRYAEAEPLLRKALTHREGYYGPDHDALMPALNRLAELFLAQKKYAEAEPFASRALKIGRGKIGLVPAALGDSLRDMGAVYAGQGKFAEAAPLYGAAVDHKVRLLPEKPHIPPKAGQISHGEFADLCREYAEVLRKAGREADAKDIEAKAEARLHPKD